MLVHEAGLAMRKWTALHCLPVLLDVQVAKCDDGHNLQHCGADIAPDGGAGSAQECGAAVVLMEQNIGVETS
jgi:hypothetical protein